MKQSQQPATSGAILKTVSTSGFRFTETVHPPDLTLQKHEHQYPTITFVLEGGLVESFGNHEHKCLPFSLLLKPAGASHTNRYSTRGARSFIIEITQEAAGSIEPFVNFEGLAPQTGTGALAPIAFDLYRTILSTTEETALDAEELALELLQRGKSKLVDQAGLHPPGWLSEIAEYIREYHAEKLSLTHLANRAGFHPLHLTRMFRKYYGLSIGDFVRRCRIDRAVKLLACPDASTSQIALILGYSDQSHFTRAFKRETGYLPGQFRCQTQLHRKIDGRIGVRK